jgi:hypothetical protein
MNDCHSRSQLCCWCGVEIMLVGSVWYKTRTADINGFCPVSPDDTHCPTPAE